MMRGAPIRRILFVGALVAGLTVAPIVADVVRAHDVVGARDFVTPSESSAEASPNHRAWLGVVLAKNPGGGVLAKHVMRSSPAMKAGLKDGDVIVTVDKAPVASPEDVISRVAEVGPGKTIAVHLRRAGGEADLPITLVEHPGDLEIMRMDKIGTFAPGWKGGKASGGAPDDLAKLKGRVVLLDFWASWCSACREATPSIVALSDKYGAQGATVVGITGDPPEIAEKGAKKFGINYGVVSDVSDDTMSDYGVRALPTMYLVDKKGVIREVFVGFAGPEPIEEAMKKLLADNTP